MIFGKSRNEQRADRQAEMARKYKPKVVFAWLPVEDYETNRFIWLEYVDRKCLYIMKENGKYYKDYKIRRYSYHRR